MHEIAIVIPVYNVESLLRRCVESLLAQTHSATRIVLVDDGSRDDSGRICDEYAAKDARFRVIHQDNGGAAAARNAALDLLAREGGIDDVAFVDSDDWVTPDYLEELVRGLLDGAEISSVRFRRTTNGHERLDDAPAVWKTMTPRAFWSLPGHNQSADCGKLFAFCLFDGIRFPVGKITEDEMTIYRVYFRASKVACSESERYAYFVRPDSVMHSPWSKRRLDRLGAWQEQMDFFRMKGFPELVEQSRKSLVVDLVDAVRNLKDRGDRDLSERYRRDLAVQLKVGGLPFSENYLAYKTAHPVRTRFLKMLGMF